MSTRRKTLNCLYFDAETGLWLPGAAMYRIHRVAPNVYLVGHATEPGQSNLVNTAECTCTCDNYFFSNAAERTSAHLCRHLRIVLLALSELHTALLPVRRHVPSRTVPLSAAQHRNLLDLVNSPPAEQKISALP